MRIGAAAPAALLGAAALAGCGTGTSPGSVAASSSTPSSAATASGISSSDPAATSSTTPTHLAPLARTKGYGTYEACEGACTGSVPASLRRALHLPADDGGPCPITIHSGGPVSPREVSAGIGFHRVTGSRWLGAQVTWVVSGTYTGPVLIRGAKLGDTAPLGFGAGPVPYDALELLDTGRRAPRVAANGRAWITYSRVQSAGCYAYQVDGTTFSDVIVFRAVN